MWNKLFTVLIVSDGGKAPTSFKLSRVAVYISGIIACFSVFSVIALGYSHNQYARQAARIPHLLEENARVAEEVRLLEADLNSMVWQMAELESLGREVRGIVNGGELQSERTELFSRNSVRDSSTTDEAIDYLKERIPEKVEELSLLKDDAIAYRQELAVTPDFWPIEGRITSPYGMRRAPLTRRYNFHQGIDIGAPYGSPVRASADGTVSAARYRAGWGNLVVINHGTYTTYYAHLKRFLVKPGDKVVKGQLIAEVGSTGYSTGPHLHFEIHINGNTIDPLTILTSEVPGFGL
ncbi:MAG: M23 family metallopeptidase [Clostridiales bacterium]|jgi:hypothetical protein|nr:M23 family metallopeptidase [Clostridiales bacterium]